MLQKPLTVLSFAFFDVDETIIRDKSMFSILKAIERVNPDFRERDILKRLDDLRNQGVDRAVINKAFYSNFKGLLRKQVCEIAENYFSTQLIDGNDFLIAPVVERLRSHTSSGVEPVFVSGSSGDFLGPLARHLRVHHLLTTRLSCDTQGQYTGMIEGTVMIGAGKQQAVDHFIACKGADATLCYAYGDHQSDANFLKCVGFPSVVAGDPELEEIARKQGWPVLLH